MLDGGFTTMRNVGSGNRDDVGLKQAIEDGYAVGPRIVPAGYALGATGGHCDDTYPSAEPGERRRRKRASATAPRSCSYQVRRQRKFGAEVIKVCATGGVFSRGDTPGQQQLTEDELRAIADEAHNAGVRVAAHAHGASGINAAIRAGIDTIEHASLVDDEGIRLAKAAQAPVWFSMDIKNTDYTQAEGTKNGELAGEHPQGPRDRPDPARQFPQGAPRRRARWSSGRCRGHAARPDRPAVRGPWCSTE